MFDTLIGFMTTAGRIARRAAKVRDTWGYGYEAVDQMVKVANRFQAADREFKAAWKRLAVEWDELTAEDD
jgi:hypothetical protein